MIKYIISLVFLLFLTNFTHAGSIIGIDEFLSDTSNTNIAFTSQKILIHHPFLVESHAMDIAPLKIKLTQNKTTAFFFTMGLLFCFAILKLAFSRYFSNLWMVFTTLHTSKRHMKEQLDNDQRASLWFFLVFCASLGFLLFKFLSNKPVFHFNQQVYLQYLICVAAIVILVKARAALLSLLAWIYEAGNWAQTYLFSNKLTHEFIGVLLFPLCILLITGPQNIQTPVLWFAIILCGTLMLYDYVRNFSILRNLFRGNFVHFLLYLCAFEILPILIIIRYTQ
ncbi:MAG: DUF4271 domain-containing protein [Bacteroidetes bacterium]|nr:DUF4271 domain-containing protein [Bacteroidota bacterium]